MLRQIGSIFLAGVISFGIINGCNYLENVQRLRVEIEENAPIKDDDKSVSDYANDNYLNLFGNYNYEPVEYVETAAEAYNFGESLEAEAAILVDYETKTVVYSKNADEQLAPASTTKLATAITAVEILDLDEVITVGNEINLIGAGSSTAGLRVGDKMSFRELLEGMLLSSGNDAAYVIARAGGEALLNDNIAYDGEEITIEQAIKRFVYEMNKNVRDIGLKNTCFTSPDGYDDPEQYTTASDLSKIALVAYGIDVINEICATPSATTGDGKYTWNTTNKLLIKDSGYYYEYARGMKTGSTDNAGMCLVSAASRDEETCISVVLGSTADGRYEDSLKLLKYFME